MRVEFNKDRFGRERRVNLERDLEDISVVKKIQGFVPHLIPDSESFKETNFHLTIFHFGRPSETEAQLRLKNPKLSQGQYTNNLRQLLLKVNQLKTGKATTITQEFSLFGDQNQYFLVLKVKKTPSLLKDREVIMDGLSQVLLDCGIKDPMDYIHSSYDWQYMTKERYNPHITLARMKPQDINFHFEIPRIELKLTYPKLANVRFIKP